MVDNNRLHPLMSEGSPSNGFADDRSCLSFSIRARISLDVMQNGKNWKHEDSSSEMNCRKIDLLEIIFPAEGQRKLPYLACIESIFRIQISLIRKTSNPKRKEKEGANGSKPKKK